MKKFIVFVLLFFLWIGQQANAAPTCQRDHEQVSENVRYKAIATIADVEKQVRSQVILFEKQEDKWNELWSLPAVNFMQPLLLFVPNNGCCIVSIGYRNGYADGYEYGDDELVVYKKDGVAAKYSVDGLLGGKIERKYRCYDWWENSYQFFDRDQSFCVWVDYAKKWVVVDLSNGALIKLDKDIENRCEMQIRKSSYEKIKKGEEDHDLEHYYHLARFLHPEDKAIFEKLLKHSCDDISYLNSPPKNFYAIKDRYRNLAEYALDALDKGEKDTFQGKDPFELMHLYNGTGTHLGGLDISAIFLEAPRKDQGAIVVWLEPVSQNTDTTTEERPVNAIGIDLNFGFLGNAEPLKIPVEIIMYGITPGKYRVRGYWDKNVKDFDDIHKDFWKRRADIQIDPGPIVKIQKGKSSSKIVFFLSKNDRLLIRLSIISIFVISILFFRYKFLKKKKKNMS